MPLLIIYDDVSSQDYSDKKSLQDQIQTLTTSLFTLTQEKSKVEASYIADKKRLLVNDH
jgi:hypothetical protein